MSVLMMKLFARRFRDAVGDDGDTGNGGPPSTPADENLDLGDELTPAQAAVKEEEELSEEEQAALPGAKAAAEEPEEEERPREKDGKFAKKDKADSTPMIPKARVDEMLAKERERAEAAERRAAEMARQSKREETQVTIQDLELKIKEARKAERAALLDGDVDKAEEFSAQRDTLNRQIARIENSAQTTEVSAQTIEQIKVDTTIERLHETYPQLDENSDEYNEELVVDVLDKRDGLMRREGLSMSAALSKAAKIVMARQKAMEAEPEGEATPKGKTLADGQKVDRKAAAVAKNVAAAAAQPPSMKNAGMDSDKSGAKGLPDITKMSTDEFDALPEATKARLMGDVL